MIVQERKLQESDEAQSESHQNARLEMRARALLGEINPLLQSLDGEPSMAMPRTLDPIIQRTGRFTDLIPRKTSYEWFSTGETHIVVDVLQPAIQVLVMKWLRLMHLLRYVPINVVPFSAKACLA
jgi:hypothetical protein